MSAASFISTTIPYVNARPHLGHAFEYVETDTYARHLASRGDDVYELTGSDENSLKNVLAAEQEGIPVQDLVDRNVVFFERMVDALRMDIRRFIRTSVDQDHIDGATRIWQLMSERGDIYAKDYSGLYCVGCEQFYTEDELIDGRCPEHHTIPELVTERNYFFRLSRYGDQLLAAIDAGQLRVSPASRQNEVTSFIRGGLADISISRSTLRARGWGIPVPDDPSQVMYVWIDALTNYINALGWTRDGDDYRRYWSGARQRIHVVGKGVLRFHAVYWPAMLLSAGLPLPTDVVVHGYITVEGQKLGKSLGNAVDPLALIDRYGIDAVRYFLLAEFSPFSDGDFSEERLVARYNGDLANGLGNLVSRVTSMVNRYRGGVTPAAAGADDVEGQLAEQVVTSSEGVAAAMARFDHREALQRFGDLVRRANAYVDAREPWHLAKAADAGDAEAARRLDTTLHHLVATIRQLGRLIWPFLPGPGEAILAAVGETLAEVPPADQWLDGIANRKVTKPASLFPRLDTTG